MSDFKISDMELESDAPDPNAHPEDGKHTPEYGAPTNLDDMSLGENVPKTFTPAQVNEAISKRKDADPLKYGSEAYAKLRLVSEGKFSWDGKAITDMTKEEIEILIPFLGEIGVNP